MKRICGATLLALVMAIPSWAQGSPSGNGRPGGNIPEVYVEAGNSFIITVPNLTKVAIGDPRVVNATVVSPSEVLVQANPGLGQPNRAIDYASSDLYVWSGNQRYVYRVVSIETQDTGFMRPNGIARMVVEPDKVLVYMFIDEGADQAALERTNIALLAMKALGLRFQIRVMKIASGLTEGGLESSTVELAIQRGTVLTGMTTAELARSQGALPPVYRTVVAETGIVDYYSFPNYDIGVANGLVVRVYRKDQIPDAIVREAMANGIVMVGMTETQLVEVLGPPVATPSSRVVNGIVYHDYLYPGRTVSVTFDRVSDVVSNNPVMTSDVDAEVVRLGQIQDRGAVIEGRAYRLKYISGQELEAQVARMLTSLGRTAPYSRGSQTEGLYTIYADTVVMAMVDNLARVLDRPDQRTPVDLVRTQYSASGVTIGFLTARFAPSIDPERINSAAAAVQRAVQSLPAGSGAPPATISMTGRTWTMTGTPEQVNLVDSMLAKLVPDIIGQEISAAIRQGQVLVGMSRRNVEAALGVRLDTGARRYLNDVGEMVSAYALNDRAVYFVEDILTDYEFYPNDDAVRNAVADKKLLTLLPRGSVETILGERARRQTRRADGTVEVEYGFGKATYWVERLVRMSDIFGSEMTRRGITVLAPYNAEQEFQLLSVEEQQMVLRRGVVMKGMTERDVARAVAESPYAIRTGDFPNEKIYTYSTYLVVFRDGLAVKVEPTTSSSPRLIALKSRRAADIVSMIMSSFTDSGANSGSMSVTADTISNRLIVRASNERFSDIERFVAAMDQQEVPQVLIEAKFVQMSRTMSRQLGVQWGLSTQANGGNRPIAGFSGSTSRTDVANQPTTNLTTGVNGADPNTTQTINQAGDGGLLLGLLGGNGFSFSGLRYTNVDVMLAAMETKGDVDVLSSPRITTINGQSATLEAINKVYDITTSQTINATTGQTTFSVVPTERKVGITLNVTPTIGQDGIVTLEIVANSSNVTGPPLNFSAGGNVIIINQIAERNSQTRVMVRSGTPLVMGGLSTRQSTASDQRVPGLGSLPIIGRLFRTEAKSNQDDDLLIFLTARIVPTDGTISPVDRITQAPRADIPNPVPSYATPVASAPGASGTSSAP